MKCSYTRFHCMTLILSENIDNEWLHSVCDTKVTYMFVITTAPVVQTIHTYIDRTNNVH